MDVLKITIMISLAIMLVVSLCIYLVRKDIFINNFKLRVGVKGIDLSISAKEKNGPHSNSDRSTLTK